MPITQLAIADDHRMFREALHSTFLQYPDVAVLFMTEDGEALLRTLKNSPQSPQVVLLDINMPGLNGFDTAVSLRQSWPEIKILAVSMLMDDYAIIKMLQCGAHGYVCKSMPVSELHEGITRVCRGYRYYSGEASKFAGLDNTSLKSLMPRITPREMKFLELCGCGMRYEEMAERLGISVRTVESYRDNLFRKLNMHDRVALALFAINIGLVPNMEIITRR